MRPRIGNVFLKIWIFGGFTRRFWENTTRTPRTPRNPQISRLRRHNEPIPAGDAGCFDRDAPDDFDDMAVFGSRRTTPSQLSGSPEENQRYQREARPQHQCSPEHVAEEARIFTPLSSAIA